MTLVKYLFLVLGSLCVFGHDYPHVKLQDGELKGSFKKSRNNETYAAFTGIPYAEPPQRFKLAKPAKPWTGIRDATKLGNECIQILPFDPKRVITGDEDCLSIHVYSPKLDGNLPVMAFIHGGAYVFGTANNQGADYFMDQPVILVTFNYRLGAFGFLNTGDGEVEANLGLKDQLLALKWIQKNIKAFGGNPEKVTIFGQSAGSASVHFHVLSPLSKGLFSRAILQSGTAVANALFMENPATNALKLGRKLGCFPNNEKETSAGLIKCLEQKSGNEIVKQDITEWYIEPLPAFAPSIEIPGKSEEIFLADKPENILESGNYNKVPMIFTACEDEGLILHAIPIANMEKLRKDINEDPLRILPLTLAYSDAGLSVNEQNWISTQIKKFYFKDQEIGQNTFQNLTNMYSDVGFIYSIERSMRNHAQHSEVHAGLLTQKGKFSLTSLFGIKEIIGVTHADDLQYLFNGAFPNMEPNSSLELFSKHLVELWVNFAYGKNLSWERLTWEPLNPEKLEKEGTNWITLNVIPKVLQNPYKERVQFWDKIVEGSKLKSNLL